MASEEIGVEGGEVDGFGMGTEEGRKLSVKDLGNLGGERGGEV